MTKRLYMHDPIPANAVLIDEEFVVSSASEEYGFPAIVRGLYALVNGSLVIGFAATDGPRVSSFHGRFAKMHRR